MQVYVYHSSVYVGGCIVFGSIITKYVKRSTFFSTDFFVSAYTSNCIGCSGRTVYLGKQRDMESDFGVGWKRWSRLAEYISSILGSLHFVFLAFCWILYSDLSSEDTDDTERILRVCISIWGK